MIKIKKGDRLEYIYDDDIWNKYLKKGEIYTIENIFEDYITTVSFVGIEFVEFEFNLRCFRKVLWIEEYKDD